MLCINECVKMGSASDAGISNYPSDFEFGKNVRNPPTFEFKLRHIPTVHATTTSRPATTSDVNIDFFVNPDIES